MRPYLHFSVIYLGALLCLMEDIALAAGNSEHNSSRDYYCACTALLDELEGRSSSEVDAMSCLHWIDGFRKGFSIGAVAAEIALGRHYDPNIKSPAYRAMFSCAPEMNNESFIRVFVRNETKLGISYS
jgi:hypothetical protein